jgi:hypothetical protein
MPSAAAAAAAAMNLSTHFTLAEFTCSQTAERMGRVIEPTEEDIRNLTRLCVEVLEPLRADLGLPIKITSGLRPAWLNQAIGGSTNSAHMDGRAADIVVSGMSPLNVCRRVTGLGLPIDQCIHEFGSWCHVGIAAEGAKRRNQLLTARVASGKTVYLDGLLS